MNIKTLTKAIKMIKKASKRIDCITEKLENTGLTLDIDCGYDQKGHLGSSIVFHPDELTNMCAMMISDDPDVQDGVASDINWWLYDKPKGKSEATFTFNDNGIEHHYSMIVGDSAKSLAKLILKQLETGAYSFHNENNESNFGVSIDNVTAEGFSEFLEGCMEEYDKPF